MKSCTRPVYQTSVPDQYIRPVYQDQYTRPVYQTSVPDQYIRPVYQDQYTRTSVPDQYIRPVYQDQYTNLLTMTKLQYICIYKLMSCHVIVLIWLSLGYCRRHVTL